MISIKERLAGFEAKVAEMSSEMTALRAANDEYKADLQARIAEHEAVKAELVSAVEASKARIVELENAMQVKDADIVSLAAERDELKAKIELVPVADASEGQKPVVDGTVVVEDKVDHVAEMNKLPFGSAQQIAYYRAHKEEIDAAFKK